MTARDETKVYHFHILNTDGDDRLSNDDRPKEEYSMMARQSWEGRPLSNQNDDEELIPSYLSRLTQSELLSAEEENTLSNQARTGNDDARRRLVEANMRLVINIAKHYHKRAVPFEDLVQEGAIGLMNAITRFDPSKGYRFSTYATHWIRQAIGRAIDNKSKAIRLPAHVSETLRRVDRERQRLRRELGHDPSAEQLATACNVSARKIMYLLQSSQDPLSLDMLVGEDESTTLGTLLTDTSVSNPEDMILGSEVRSELNEILASLNEREQMVMRRRLGFEDAETHVLQDIGKELQLSRERVRQIEAQALKKLRVLAHRRRLRDLFNR